MHCALPPDDNHGQSVEIGQQKAHFDRPSTALSDLAVRPLLAGLRPSAAAVATSPARLHLSLLRDLQRVVDLDAKISDGALSELI